jgi:hypothetical protein
MVLQNYSSTIKVDLFKLESQVKSQAEEIGLMRAKSLDNTQVHIPMSNQLDTDSMYNTNFELVNN